MYPGGAPAIGMYAGCTGAMARGAPPAGRPPQVAGGRPRPRPRAPRGL